MAFKIYNDTVIDNNRNLSVASIENAGDTVLTGNLTLGGDNMTLGANGRIEAISLNLTTSGVTTVSDLSLNGNAAVGYETSLRFVGARDSRVDYKFDTDGVDHDPKAGDGNSTRVHYIDKNFINANAIKFPAMGVDFDTQTTNPLQDESNIIWRDNNDRLILNSASGRAFLIGDIGCTVRNRYLRLTGTANTEGGAQYSFSSRSVIPAGMQSTAYGLSLDHTLTGSASLDPGDDKTNMPRKYFIELKSTFDGWTADDQIGETYGINIGSLSPGGTTYDGLSKTFGIRLGIGKNVNRENYNIYAAGNAPSYFAGNIECDGLINGAFSLRMQSDDPAAFTTSYSTDEEGNQVENQTYVGTTEDLLSIIKDLRARVASLEADHATLMANNNNGGGY